MCPEIGVKSYAGLTHEEQIGKFSILRKTSTEKINKLSLMKAGSQRWSSFWRVGGVYQMREKEKEKALKKNRCENHRETEYETS